MIINSNEVQHILKIVQNVMDKEQSLDKSIHHEFRTHKISNEFERAAIMEISYNLIRWWRLLYEIDAPLYATKKVNYYHILGNWIVLNKLKVPSSADFKNINPYTINDRYKIISKTRAIQYSIPDWLDEIGYQVYQDAWENILASLNETPPLFLRTNTLKITAEHLSQLLNEEGYQNQIAENSETIVLKKRSNIFASNYYKEGYFEVQDAGSQLISTFLDVRPGMRVADACAGNGGKTLHLACLMQNKGKIIAMDTAENKLDVLRKRASKAGIDIIETRSIEGQKTIKRHENSFDRLLLDVPCSGTGVLRRNPEIKWQMNPEKINSLHAVQAEILDRYSALLKKGGMLVYSTCSILPSENQEQIKAFLATKNSEFELIKEQFVSPEKTGFDGFYMAQLKKK
jgi:16S rRNA (cytosine967-C5)-methyltransferase